MTTYSSEIEQRMQRLYKSFNEKDRRRYAAIEAAKLGCGILSRGARNSGKDGFLSRFGDLGKIGGS